MTERVRIAAKDSDGEKSTSTINCQKINISQAKKSPFDQVMSLQRAVGNQAVQGLFKSCDIQPKVRIGQPGDKHEREADRVAEQVMRIPVSDRIPPLVHRRHPAEQNDAENLNVAPDRSISEIGPSPEIQNKIGYDDCDRLGGTAEEDAIKAAHEKAKERLSLAIDQLANNSDTVYLFRGTFKAEGLFAPPYDFSKEKEMIDQVISVYKKSLAGLRAEGFNYECDYEEDWNWKCEKDTPGWTNVSALSPLYDIHLCWGFFDLKTAEDQADTIIHEAVHKWGGVGHGDDPLDNADRYDWFISRLDKRGMLTPQPLEEAEKKETIQPKADFGQIPEIASDLESGINEIRGGGRPLGKSVRAFFEPRFGSDFSKVRVHAGGKAAETARAIHADAFALRNHVIFGGGHYAPETEAGKRLIAHELVHTLQQSKKKNHHYDSGLLISRKPKSEKGKEIYEALFEKSPAGVCKKWVDKPTKKYPKTTDQIIVEEFRANLKAFIAEDPMRIKGTVTPHTTEASADKAAVLANKTILKKYGSHIKSPLSGTEIKKRVHLMTFRETFLPSYIKKWLANYIFQWTSIEEYCLDESDKRFQKVIDDIFTDRTMIKDVRILSGRQGAFFEGAGRSRNVYIHEGLKPSEAESILTHELVHFYAHKSYLDWNAKMSVPRYINEGFTEYLAREAMSSSARTSRTENEEQFGFIRDKVAAFLTKPVEKIASAFFAGKVWEVENVSTIAKSLFEAHKSEEKKK